ncbi:MAG TPA: EVE domain-containing protein [Acidimicrobiia bacterium]|nr:EVE domain-containing protein [Acidimicrobiia bacterium]
MRYWLYKSEPEVYGIDHLERDVTTIWDGVRNYQARINLNAAAIGDFAFFYHSSANPPGIAGLAEVVETAVVDPLQFDPDSKYFDPRSKPAEPRWITVRVKFVEKFPTFLPLELLRRSFTIEELVTLRKGNRLSVTAVADATADRLLAMGRG